jgi:universal stress protein A
MITFKNILLLTDLSDNADAAVPYAIELAKRDAGRVQLVHVFEDLTFYTVPISEAPVAVDLGDYIKGTHADRGKKLGEKADALAKSTGVTVIPVLLSGHPVNQIADYAKTDKADLIVVATHGRTGAAHAFYGSVAERIVRQSPCPVLTVRPK